MVKHEIDYILNTVLDTEKRISDINITVGRPLQVELDGKLYKVDMQPPLNDITPFQSEVFALNLINNDRRLTKNLIEKGSCDLSYEVPGKAHLRVNIFSQQGKYSIVCRKLETEVPSIEKLNLPAVFQKMAGEKNGIVLFTGATGIGKTTSLAAILNEINHTQSVHVVTLEDPIEYRHAHIKSTFNMRELGIDFDTYANGLRAALRQAPKVILVGEMRDRETVEIAMSAAETGHLVLSTLHTVNAGQTINRILGMFKYEEENQIRTRLSEMVRWVVSQRLLPRTGSGRIAAFEIMGSNLRVKEAILKGESKGKTFYEIIQAGMPFGMITFDDSISNLYEHGLITEGIAMAYASNKAYVGRKLDMIKLKRGEATSDIQKLEVDREYGELY